MMERDDEHHARWKHKWGWPNRGDVWVKIATEWAGKEDWMRARKMKSTPADKCQFVTFAIDGMNCPPYTGRKRAQGLERKSEK